MPEKKFVKTFRTAKIVQLCFFFIMETVFFLILVLHPSLGKHIYYNEPLFYLCVIMWILMIMNFIWLIYDFRKLRSFALESHILNRHAYLDGMTGLLNRNGLDTVLNTYSTPESIVDVGCFMVNLNNIQEINNSLGRAAGDLAIQNFCLILESVGERFGVVGRNSGNDFLVLINACTHASMKQFITALEEQINEYNSEHTVAPLAIKYAYTLNNEEHAEALNILLTATYNKLYTKNQQ